MYPEILASCSLKDKNPTLVIYLPCEQDGPHATVLGWDSLEWNLISYPPCMLQVQVLRSFSMVCSRMFFQDCARALYRPPCFPLLEK